MPHDNVFDPIDCFFVHLSFRKSTSLTWRARVGSRKAMCIKFDAAPVAVRPLNLSVLCACSSTQRYGLYFFSKLVRICVSQKYLSNFLVRHHGRKSECTLRSCQSFLNKKKLYLLAVFANGSALFVNNNVLGSKTLEAPKRVFALSFLSSRKLAAIAHSRLKLSVIPLSSNAGYRNRVGCWGNSILDLIVRSGEDDVSTTV